MRPVAHESIGLPRTKFETLENENTDLRDIFNTACRFHLSCPKDILIHTSAILCRN